MLKSILVITLLLCLNALAVDKDVDVLKNGDFEMEGAAAGAQGWTRGNPSLVNFVLSGGNRFCRMELPTPKAAIIMQKIKIDPKWKSLDFSVRIRAKNVKTGAQDWQTGQFQFLFLDKDGKVVGGWNRLKVVQDTNGWELLERRGLKVPENAVELKAQIGVWGASGTFDFDDANVIAPSKPTRPFTHVPKVVEPQGPIARDTYYVATNGSDDNDGKTLETPFRTIQKAANVMKAGGTCLIRGGVYRETVRPANSGQKGAPITFQPYENEKVVISGTEPIKNWTPDKDGVYKAPMPADFFVSKHNQSDQIFVNDQMMILAQWPNTSLRVSEPQKSVTTKFISKSRDKARNMTTGVVEDASLAPATDDYYVGAEIFFQPNFGGWSWSFTGKVVGQTGKQLTFESRSNSGKDYSHNTYADRSRYNLYNLRKLLDTDHEWFHDMKTGTLYLDPPGDADPNTLKVEAKKRDFAFVLDDLAYITIKGLQLFGCSITTNSASGGHCRGWTADGRVIYPWPPRGTIASSHHITIDGIKAKYINHFTDRSGHFFLQWGTFSGIALCGQDHLIKNSVIQYSAGNGILLRGARNKAINNLILDTDYSGIDCAGINTVGPGISVDHEIAYNTIRRTGRCGITPRHLKNSDPTKGFVARIHHNDISQFMVQDWDGGAIYRAGNMEFTRIDHNLCHDAWPNVDNIPDVGSFTVGGVYLDYGSNTIVDHNVTWNVEWGIHLQAVDNNLKEGNLIVYNNTVGVKPFGTPPPAYGPFGIWVNKPAAKHPGSVIRNNIIFNVNPTKGYKPMPEHGKRKKLWQAMDNLKWNGKADSPTNPKFVDLDDGNLWLQSDSPLIDAGKAIPEYKRDGVTIPPYNEIQGGKPDIGAYESGKQPWRAGCDLPEARTLK